MPEQITMFDMPSVKARRKHTEKLFHVPVRQVELGQRVTINGRHGVIVYVGEGVPVFDDDRWYSNKARNAFLHIYGSDEVPKQMLGVLVEFYGVQVPAWRWWTGPAYNVVG